MIKPLYVGQISAEASKMKFTNAVANRSLSSNERVRPLAAQPASI